MKALELGCGTQKREGVVGVDINPRVEPDVLHDLDVLPYPFDDDEFDTIHCYDVLEHLSDVPAVMQELHRILCDRGTLHISGPFPSGSDYVTDPTHRRAFTSRSFDYFIEGTDLFDRYRYSDARFELVSCRYQFAQANTSFIRRKLHRFVQRRKPWFERKFMYLLQVEGIVFELRAIKSRGARDDAGSAQARTSFVV